MIVNILHRLYSLFRFKPNPNEGPDLQFIARQLRKPAGDFAPEIAVKMDIANKPLYELTLDTMQVANGDTILEIGFGSGKFFEKLFTAANNLMVYGIDYSAEMVELAKRHNPEPVSSGRLQLVTGSSDKLPYPDQSFDKVFCNMVIFFWDQPENHLKEIYRVLKPGGKFYAGFRTKESMLRFPFTRFGFVLYDPDQWKSILTENGFFVDEIRRNSDPGIELDGKKIHLESVCMASGKLKI